MILTFQLTKDHRQVVEMFRRAVFNVFAHNRDDHGRQFAYLMDRTGAWSLAPAYDLTHADGPSGEHSTAIMGEGRAPGERHLRAMAAEFSIPLPDAVSIIDQVRSAVDRWRDFAGESGVGRTSQSRIGAVIAPRRARRKP